MLVNLGVCQHVINLSNIETDDDGHEQVEHRERSTNKATV